VHANVNQKNYRCKNTIIYLGTSNSTDNSTSNTQVEARPIYRPEFTELLEHRAYICAAGPRHSLSQLTLISSITTINSTAYVCGIVRVKLVLRRHGTA